MGEAGVPGQSVACLNDDQFALWKGTAVGWKRSVRARSFSVYVMGGMIHGSRFTVGGRPFMRPGVMHG